ncbi:MAG TPA: MFS transporter [Gemmataceae bacterium]|nr:MFS transporter [Gemmataceae bacterium]
MAAIEKPPSERRALIEAIIASTVGTTIEWYDFFLYGTAAALVFPKLFFPEFDPFVGQILSFGTFTVGFVARPLGGIVFGYLGDRIGRKSTLVATLLLMGISTVIIGVLPTYSRIGPWAPILLTGLRFLQGLGVGGEWGGAVLLALEYGHRGRRGFFASWPQTGVPLGLLLSTGVMGTMQGLLAEEVFLRWGWRLPFLLSGVLIAVGLLIRSRVLETPLFRQLLATKQVAHAPLRETVIRHWREILLAAGARIAENSCFYLFSTYVIAYARDVLNLQSGLALRAVLAAALCEFAAMPLYGILSDYWSRRAMYMVGCISLLLFAFPYYGLLHTREPALVFVAVVISLVGSHAILYSVQASLIPELFGTRLRYTGASLGYQMAAPLAGGMAPLIAASLVKAFPGQYWPLALYVAATALISFISVYFLAETSRKDLSGN